jgi:hypothetical protein
VVCELMLNFHEHETCEGIIRYLERRDGVVRSDVRRREGHDTPRSARVEMPARKYGDYRGTLVTAQPAGVPFQVSLVRFDGIGTLPGLVQLKHLTRGGDEQRATRIQRTCDDKFGKLAQWKRSEGARSILVLEDNDVQLTNSTIVAETFLPIAIMRDDVPDETYLVSTCTSPWRAWPILIDTRTYFDLAAGGPTVHFDMDDSGRLIRGTEP